MGGDVDGAIADLVAEYERNGDATVRNLAVERGEGGRGVPLIHVGRQGHEAGVQHVFPAALEGLTGVARWRRIGQLVAVTDVHLGDPAPRSGQHAATGGVARALTARGHE